MDKTSVLICIQTVQHFNDIPERLFLKSYGSQKSADTQTHSNIQHAMSSTLLITFTDSLDPEQDQQNVSPDLDQKMFDTLIVFLKEYFEKSQQTTKA